jgi:hypothetical protein
MFRPITIAAVLGVILCTVGAANAATYCAKYIGGHERVHSGARSQCEFSTLSECRARVRGAAEGIELAAGILVSHRERGLGERPFIHFAVSARDAEAEADARRQNFHSVPRLYAA